MQYLQMSRSLGVNKQRTPVVQEPPRGPIMSIASAKNMNAAQNTAQQQQQQMLKQQYMQQQQQQKLKQQKQQMANQSPQQPQAVNGMPSHVTVPQAISVIVSRLNSIERKISKSAAPLEEDQSQLSEQQQQQQQQESIDLDLTIDQILERLQQLEGTQSDSLVVSKSEFEQLNNKVSKLDSDLRDYKDMVLKMQSLIITTTEQVTKLSMQVSNNILPETDN